MTASPARLALCIADYSALPPRAASSPHSTAPGVTSAATATVDHRLTRSDRREQLYVHSPAMGRVVGSGHPAPHRYRPTPNRVPPRRYRRQRRPHSEHMDPAHRRHPILRRQERQRGHADRRRQQLLRPLARQRQRPRTQPMGRLPHPRTTAADHPSPDGQRQERNRGNVELLNGSRATPWS